jgi:hypothetical protein
MRTRLVQDKGQKPQEAISTAIDCPICKGEGTLMVEIQSSFQPTDPVSENVIEEYLENYLCVRCGYTTTSDMVVGSDAVEAANKTSPKLVKDLSLADNVRNLVWFPSVINISPKGICYPDGVPNEWRWVVAPYVPLTEEERASYLSSNDSDRFKYRLAVEKSVKFDKHDFQNALAFLGALTEKSTND